jgi:uncharacterized protein
VITFSRPPAVLPKSDYLRARPPRYVLSTETRLERPLEDVFSFFSDASNLSRITPPDMGFTVLTPQPINLHAGAVIDYRVHVVRVPLRWRTIIDVWEPPLRFVDSQDRGPYACWWHEHRFEADGAATRMFDTVYYAPPLGPLGALAQHVLIKRELRRIFSYRAHAIKTML